MHHFKHFNVRKSDFWEIGVAVKRYLGTRVKSIEIDYLSLRVNFAGNSKWKVVDHF